MSLPYRSLLLRGLGLLLAAIVLRADPLTKQYEIDFGRDVASRNLKGLATRTDGRILPGPVFTDLDGPKIGGILWTLRPDGRDRFIVGTGPEGKVAEITVAAKQDTYTVRELAHVNETSALAVLPLANGSLLVGSTPPGALYLFKDGKAVARVPLPVDAVFDLLALPDGSVLAGTGNPGRIYRIDPAKFARAGVDDGKAGDDKALAAKGVTLFGEIRDSSVRRLARLADGSLVAGSSPKGNVYRFDAAGGAPVVLQENRDSEVVDLLPLDDGSFYAAVVFTAGDNARLARVTDPKAEKKDKDEKPTFLGRSNLVYFPAGGFPESVLSRTNIAFYRLARQRDWIVISAGEQGDTLGYDPVARRGLTFAGSSSSQVNDIAPLADGRLLLLRNNAPGLALMAFNGQGPRALETKRLDLGAPATFGDLRFARMRGLAPGQLHVEVSTNFGNDEIEGWTPWQTLATRDGGYFAAGLRGRYARLRLRVDGAGTEFQIDKATLFNLPQNRRPALVDFRIFPPNLALLPAGEPPPSATTTLGQLLYPNPRDAKDENSDRRKGAFMSSAVIPQTGAQIVYWTVTDPDGDNLNYTFSIQPDGGDTWTDLAVNTTETYVQFDTSGLAEGLYLTRLRVAEQAPRPRPERLAYDFETDTLLVDRTPPVISHPVIRRESGRLILSIDGHDALSLLEGAEFVLNNGEHETVTHPVDGILDGKSEQFQVEIPEARAAGATSVEILVYDAVGNSSSVRVPLN
ncbi:MAG TPA: hypothetical protein VL200_01880 [Lacunisphaera sp.]|jgi:hypothetical protein|nr:hypothetical protein [Lacunisphaera sp.]